MKLENKIKTLGFYQIIGGILGCLVTVRFLPSFGSINGGILFLILIIISLHLYSIFCGYLLLKNKLIKGLNLSIFNQFIQILSFGVLGFYFEHISGIYAGIKLNLINDAILTFMSGISSSAIVINDHIEYKELSINIIALIMVNVIYNLKSEVEKRESKIELK
ncbi:hypothetical protein ACFO3U_11425 [Flavobacterium ponti]|uniref:Uncharacterized protein n=1 Tax=Flavobacterium ponti TaxID=665133 RepID=A0ABV9P967_9FLAO